VAKRVLVHDANAAHWTMDLLPRQRKRKTQPLGFPDAYFFFKKNRNERMSVAHSSPCRSWSAIFLARFVPLLKFGCPAMRGQIPALFAKKFVAQTSKKRLRAKNLLGNHPQKRAHIHQNTRVLSPRMGFEARLPSDARSAQTGKVFV
jgi:hypothetical protein